MSRRKGIRSRGDGGLGQMIQDLEDLSAALSPESIKARLDPLTAEMTEGLRDTMPVRTGALKASGHWSSDVSEGEYRAEIEFGGPTAPHAPYVVGRGVNGAHPWDAVPAAFEERIEDEINDIWRSAMDH